MGQGVHGDAQQSLPSPYWSKEWMYIIIAAVHAHRNVPPRRMRGSHSFAGPLLRGSPPPVDGVALALRSYVVGDLWQLP